MLLYCHAHGLSTVLSKLKDETASGVTHTSIDGPLCPDVAIDSRLINRLFPVEQDDSSEILYFIHSISTSQVQAYGQHIAARCATGSALFGSFFFRRRGVFDIFPAEIRRLVPTLAYQICVAPNCPQNLKVEILGAFYMEPDIPEQTLYNQLQKLLITPLRRTHLSTPVIFVLDSIDNCEDAKDVIIPIAKVVKELSDEINIMQFVITSHSYRYVLDTLQNQHIQASFLSYHPIPSGSSIKQILFHARNWRYELPDLLQSFVTGALGFVLWMWSPFLLASFLSLVGFSPPAAILLAYAGVLLSSIGLLMYGMLAFQVRMYQATARLLGSRD